MPERILIVDDQVSVREAITYLISKRPEWSICGEAADGREAVEMARTLLPDVVLMDISMPRMDGIEATRIIRKEVPESEVIIVSQSDPAVVERQAQAIGAAGWLSKSNLAAQLVPTIQDTVTQRNRTKACEAGLSPHRFFRGGGEMGERIRSFDWSRTVLGPVPRWPEPLKTAVRICIGSRNPIVLWWGRSALTQFYNDAFISFLGSRKHPAFLGGSGRECWSEIWETMGPMLEQVFATGEATWSEDFLYVLNRNLPREEGYFTFSYSPIWGDADRVEGIFCACYETTARVIGDRRLRTLRDLGRTVSLAKTPQEACSSAAKILEGNQAEIPFALLYLVDDDERRARLTARVGFTGDSAASPALIDLTTPADASPWPLKRVLDIGSAEIVSDLTKRFERLPGGAWPESPESAVVVPIASGQSRPTGFLVAGLSPRRIVDSDYRSFFDLIAGHIATAIANSRAYEVERKRAEALAELDRAKTTFFSNVSHEFRTPLTLILSPLEDLLAETAGTASEQRARMEVVHRNSMRLLKLVNTLLDFSRIEAGRLEASYEPIDLGTLTTDIASIFRSAIERAGLRLVVNCPSLDEPVYVDQEMWEKIVLNLLSNAFKFTFEGEIEVALHKINGCVELSVRDTGSGIPSPELPHLFERFYRVKGAHGRTFEGSGIGLALVQELAKMHSGTVRVESEVNRGSKFIVTIPLGKNHLPADRIGAERTLASTADRGEAYVQEAVHWLGANPGAPDNLQLSALLSPIHSLPSAGTHLDHRARILLADDNADMREYVGRLLGRQYEVVTAADGAEALTVARQRPPDLVLADVMMPRLDGFGLLQGIRQDASLKSVPVILLSARAGEEARIEGLGAGADDYVVKPFSARELLARVASQLAMARLRSEAAELERKLRTQAELEHTRLHELFMQTPAAIAVLSGREHLFTFANQDYVRVTGRQYPEEFVGKTLLEALPELKEQGFQELLDEVYRTGIPHVGRETKVILNRSVTAGPEEVYFNFVHQPMRNAGGQVEEILVHAVDVTEQVMARKEIERREQVLRQSESRFRELSQRLDSEVKSRTRELEQRTADVERQSEQLRELSWQLLRIQDEERRHLARDLHDSAGQTLTVLGINLSALVGSARQSAPELAETAAMAQKLVEEVTQEIRTTSYLLHPPLLDESGLPSALCWYVQGLAQRSGLAIDFNISEGFGRLPREMELVIFRVVQECLTNIHRHSGSTTALVQVERDAERVVVEVRDQGRGMPARKLAEIQSGGSGVGIKGMRERLRQFRGEMTITSADIGTTVRVTIPVPKQEAVFPHRAAPALGSVV